MSMREAGTLYFYELHEGDDEIFHDVLLAHDAEYDEQEFLGLVLEAREAVVERFEEDSLSEAIANELERRHGFVHIDDQQLRAAVNVSVRDGETVLAAVDEGGPGAAAGDGDEDEEFRSLLVDIEPDDSVWRN